MNINIKRIHWEDTIPIRHRVLWPNKTPEFCFVEGDEEAWHYGAYINDTLVCVASVYTQDNQARLRKFATLENYQNKGIGSQVLTYILSSIKERGINYFWCDARESAADFYKQFGLQKDGEKFYKSEIPYYKMHLNLYS